jgi:hypothetical protein
MPNDYRLLNAGVASLDRSMHALGPSSPRGEFARLASNQGDRYDPSSPVGQALVQRRNPGRTLTPYSQIPSPQYPPNRAFGRRGTGVAYVPPKLNPAGLRLGRPMIANHELEHAYGQSARMPADKTEIAPVLGDIVFGSENFRRQEKRPLLGNITVGHKNQSAEWMRQQAQQHGYFDGRTMTSLLGTPEGISWIKQAALGPLSNRKD